MTEASGIPSWCTRGQQVVCLFDGWVQLDCMSAMPARQPMMNEVLTIREALTSDQFNDRAKPSGITLSGFAVLLSFDELGHDWLYVWHRFRPLVGMRKTEAEDISIFLPLLKPQKARERA